MRKKFLKFLRDKELFYIFIYKLSVRRHFIPIMAIYYLTLPNATLNQLGIFTAIGYLISIFIEIPSGYISDTIGHKKTLYISRLAFILSLVSFILGGSILINYSFYLFMLGVIFLNFGFAFNSGTFEAFFYEILEKRGEEKNYTKINARMSGNVSLIAVFLIMLLPLTIQINYLAPFYINIFFDLIGIFALFKLPNPSDSTKIIKGESQSFISSLKDSIKLGFLPFGIFIGIIGGILFGQHSFNSVYLQDLGLTVIFIGSLMGLSRLLWFIFSRYIHLLEEHFSMSYILLFQIIIYGSGLFIVAYSSNLIIVLVVMATVTAFNHVMNSLNTKFIFTNYLENPKYKATLLSVKSQIGNIIGIIVALGFGYFVEKTSFETIYYVLSGILFISLSFIYFFIKIDKNKF